jgi:hypothetical protein
MLKPDQKLSVEVPFVKTVDIFNLILKGNEDGLIQALDEDPERMNYFTTKDGIASCHFAALLGHIGIIVTLLERGVDINTRDESGSMLHSAARFGNGLLSAMLVTRGIDINIMTEEEEEDNETALHVASRYGHDHIVMLLLKFGIDIADDIDEYAPTINEDEQEEGEPTLYFTDCRPMIIAELEDRRKKTQNNIDTKQH